MVTLATLVYYKVGRYFDIEIRLDRAMVEGKNNEQLVKRLVVGFLHKVWNTFCINLYFVSI